MKICFVSLSSYPTIAKKNLNYVGGAEVQQVLMAHELNRLGNEITFITYGEGQKGDVIVDGIRIIPIFTFEESSNIIFPIKILQLLRAMKASDCDIFFYEAGAPGIVGILAKILGKKFVYYIPTDAILDDTLHFNEDATLLKVGHWLDINLADDVLTQTEHQNSLLLKKHGLHGQIIQNAFPINNEVRINKIGKSVLWVATIGEVKQPELFLELARSIPNAKFIMVGGPGGSQDLYNSIKKDAEAICNLDFRGFVPFDKIDSVFQEGSILVNTSRFEGFPNTFIQAWLNGIPVVTLNSDPDEVICKYGLGYHSKNFSQMVEDVELILINDNLRNAMANKAISYSRNKHDVKKVAAQMIDIFNKIKSV